MDLSNTLRQARPEAMTDDQWRLRLEIAAWYRVVSWIGWTELIFNHISGLVPSPAGRAAPPKRG